METTIIDLDLDECNGCTLCVEDCPTDVFEMESDNKAHIVDAESCIDCLICEEECPTDAIHLMAA